MADSVTRPRLLIVESDDSIRRVLARVLGRRFELTPLSTGTSAVGRLSEERFDILLLDLCLDGDIAGIDVLRTARSLDPTLPVIVTTPAHEVRTEEATAALGAVAYLAKPYDTSDLEEPLARASVLAKLRHGA